MKLGVLSFRISLIPIVISLIVFLVYLISVYVLMVGPGFGALFGIIFLPLVLLLLFVIDCVALIIGIAGIFEKNGKKIPRFWNNIVSSTNCFVGNFLCQRMTRNDCSCKC